MTIRWQRAAGDPATMCYFVGDEPTGSGDAGFDRVLERVAATDEPVTVLVPETSLGGADFTDDLPFAARMDELQRCLGARQLRFA
jgi:hypothetical protein